MSKNGKVTVEKVKKLSSPDELELYSYVIDRAEDVASEIVMSINEAEIDEGKAYFIEGPLSSGKTVVATMVASKLKDSKHSVGIFQPLVPERSDILADKLFSRSGVTYPSKTFGNKKEIESMFHENDVVIVDELHLVPQELQSYFVSEMKKFRERGGETVLFSILYNSQGDPFVFVELCRMLADREYKMKATCQKCGSTEAYIGQRLINGKPTSISDPEYLSPSDIVVYEPRCRECFVYNK